MEEKKDSTLEIKFSVKGNGNDPHGNPMSKIKLTGRQQWTPKAQAYAVYKSHVVSQLMDAMKGTDLYPMIIRNIGLTGKPLTTKSYGLAEMSVSIRFADGRHGDPEGVFGAIADALFKQDKFLDGRFVGIKSGNGRGEVDVAILLRDNAN